jgi:hypothetical protein
MFDVVKLAEAAFEKGWTVSFAVALGAGVILYAPDSWTWVHYTREARIAHGALLAPLFYISAAHLIALTTRNASDGLCRLPKRRREARRMATLYCLTEQQRVVLTLALMKDGHMVLPTTDGAVRSLLAVGILVSAGGLRPNRCADVYIEPKAHEELRKYPALLDVPVGLIGFGGQLNYAADLAA